MVFSFKLYDKHYKRLMLVPLILGILFLGIIFVFPKLTLGLDFVGGTRVIVNTDQLQEAAVKELLTKELGLPEVKVNIVASPFGTSARIEYAEPKDLATARLLLDEAIAGKAKNPQGAVDKLQEAITLVGGTPASDDVTQLIQQASEAISAKSDQIFQQVRQQLTQKFSLPANTSFTIEQVTPTFGASFLSNTIFVAIFSIVLLIIVIFVFFREFVPSVAIIEAVLFDMLTALALATVFGFSVTLSTVAALLMLVGYSVDTDILLTTRALKRQDKTILERCNDTLLTGLTVTATVAGAALVMLIVSWMAQITVI